MPSRNDATPEGKVFEYLFTTKGINKGTGLGLSISLQIVQEKHQGKLTYISFPGKGTEFTIELPIQAIHNTADS
ncbi:MAG: ATP-binding protein [Mastigocoleus sp. MO_167.B18]|nr:ATP-binding protein [Mastigocoleus sp. MO_167.B18]